MALVWLRVYPTYELLGFFFDLHKRNAQLNVRAALEVLDSLDDFPRDRPGRDRPKMRTAAAVMEAFPQVRIIIDGKEQRCNRPEGFEERKPYYSGKKKCHTLRLSAGGIRHFSLIPTSVASVNRHPLEPVDGSRPGGYVG